MSDTENPSTKRWRRWKARQKTGEIVVDLAVDHALITLLLDAGEIDERSSRSRKRLADAIARVATNALASRAGR